MQDNVKPELPEALVAVLNDLMRQSGELRRAGNAPASLAISDEAWDVIPEPKTEWNFYPQRIAAGVVETIVEREACGVLDIWLERMYATHFDVERQTPYTNLMAGHALHECGRTTEALALFRQVYETHGAEYFVGVHRPYLDMVEAN